MILFAIIQGFNYSVKLLLLYPFHLVMLPGMSRGICHQQSGGVWRILAPCAGLPPGFEHPQLNNDVRVKVREMKRERVDKLSKVYPELLQAQDVGHLGMVAVSKVMSAPAGVERNSLLDIIVLTLAEDNRCGNRVDFDHALKDMFGDNLDAVWRSRFHNSVHHSLRVPAFRALIGRRVDMA